MAKGYNNLWSKKSKKGMKTIGKAVDFSINGGAFVANEMAKSKKGNQSDKIPQKEYTEKDWSFALTFFIVFIVVIILVISIFDINYRGFLGGIKFFAVAIGSIFASGIITLVIVLFFESKPQTRQKDAVNSEEEKKKINDITQFLVADNEIADLENVYSKEQLSKKILVKSFEKAIDIFLNDGLLSVEKEKRLANFIEVFDFSQDELNRNETYKKIVQSAILRDVLQGEIPQKIKLEEQILPFSLNKNEKLIWVCSNVNYYEETVQSSYVGGSSGLSMKIAKGLYYRTSNFKGQRVETQSLKYRGIGILGFTDKHIYFYSVSKSFRISYSKIMILLPYENAIRLQKDGVTAKPQIFDGISGWFAYNLIVNLKNKD